MKKIVFLNECQQTVGAVRERERESHFYEIRFKNANKNNGGIGRKVTNIITLLINNDMRKLSKA